MEKQEGNDLGSVYVATAESRHRILRPGGARLCRMPGAPPFLDGLGWSTDLLPDTTFPLSLALLLAAEIGGTVEGASVGGGPLPLLAAFRTVCAAVGFVTRECDEAKVAQAKAESALASLKEERNEEALWAEVNAERAVMSMRKELDEAKAALTKAERVLEQERVCARRREVECDKAIWEVRGEMLEAVGKPIPMLLSCPMPGCAARHIDEGEWSTRVHHTHSCQECGHTWRPAVVPTFGVRFLPGFKNDPETRADSGVTGSTGSASGET